MEDVATGDFDVQLTPTGGPDAVVGSMAISKTFESGKHFYSFRHALPSSASN